eukprot:2160017-Pleurochrysis_carterae.AAC.1
MVDDFVGISESDAADNGSNEVSKVLAEAERLQPKQWKALKKMGAKGLSQALHPCSKGKAQGVELLPVVFGLSPPYNLITINFEPLFDAVECCIGRFRRDLLENI